MFIFKVFLEFLSYMRFDRSGYLLTGKKKGEMGSVLSAMDFGQNICKLIETISEAEYFDHVQKTSINTRG